MTLLEIARHSSGLTQHQLARRIGVSQPIIHQLEAELREPTPEMAERLAAVLGVPAQELFRLPKRGRRHGNHGQAVR